MKRKIWPYILPLPVESAQRCDMLVKTFRSKTSVQLLSQLALDRPTYQRDLIEKLRPVSNKTVLRILTMLVSANILEEGMERVSVKGRRVWVKWYKPTFLGKWLILLLSPPKQIPHDELREIFSEVFAFYVSSVLDLCSKHGIDPKILKDIFESVYHGKKGIGIFSTRGCS